ncbi:hypothetical protein B0H15DRAFT_968740 [Mycena belliarum]|uniref:Uncharacterized protein n=1 Tax=Mycena belliarum TaxID=1033014 RepID=A0AAD6TLP6_9AGAR|nr:hypothetical protein B0H15DRAFT_968740 [Mycena belliae]
MAPKHWANELQLEWLHSKMGGYLASKAGGDQIDFFTKLDEAWLGRWPEEEACGLPAKESGTELSPAETEQLAVALNGRKQQLRVWYRNHVKKDRESGTKATKKDDTLSISAALWRETQRRRDPQRIELWQKAYPERVKDALEAGGYYAFKAGELEWVMVDEDTNDAIASERLKRLAAERMKLWRKITLEAFEDESDEITAEMERELKKVKAKKLESKEPVKLTPESADASIKQLEAIIEHFHDLIQTKTGWRGFSVLGGPTPSSGGRLNYTVYSCGRTPAGNTFRESHPKWEQDVGQPFSQWLSRCYTRFERDSMALPDNGDDSDSDVECEADIQEEEQVKLKANEKVKAQKKAAGPQFKAPKRHRKSAKSIAATTATATNPMGQVPQGSAIPPPPIAPAQVPSTPMSGAPQIPPPPIAPAHVPSTPMSGAPQILPPPITLAQVPPTPPVAASAPRDWLARAASPLDENTWEALGCSWDSELPPGPGPDDYAPELSATGTFYLPEAGYDLYIPMSPRTAAGLNTVLAHGMDPMPSFEPGGDISFGAQASGVVSAWGDDLGGWGAPMNGDTGSSKVFSFAGATAGEADGLESGVARPAVLSPYRPFSAPYTPLHLSSPLRLPSPPKQSLRRKKRDTMDEFSGEGEREDDEGDDGEEAGLEDDNDGVKGGGPGTGFSNQSSDEDDEPLSRYYPASRPMANAPKSKKVPPKTKTQLAKTTRGGGRRVVSASKARGPPATTAGDDAETSREEGNSERAGPAREKPVRTPFTFLQTYGPNGEVIPLPLSMAGEIFGNKGPRGKAGAVASGGERPKPKPRNRLHNQDGPSDLIILPRPIGGAMPTIPELGRPGRNRRPPKNANDDLAVLEALKARKADYCGRNRNKAEVGRNRGGDKQKVIVSYLFQRIGHA